MRQCWHYWDRGQLAELLLSRRRITRIDCWEWTLSHPWAVYSRVRVEGKYHGVHVVSAWVWLGRELTADRRLVVRHKCDNPACFNPAHLVPGTQKENVADMYDRGRPRHSSHCRRGHQRTSGNTWFSNGRAVCKECNAINRKAAIERQRVIEESFTYDTNDTDSYRTAA